MGSRAGCLAWRSVSCLLNIGNGPNKDIWSRRPRLRRQDGRQAPGGDFTGAVVDSRRYFGAIQAVETMISFKLNGNEVDVDVPEEMPLLWVLRDHLAMTGTKYGCGIALCGACTVHVNETAMRSCVLPVSAVQGAEVRTIEGLAGEAGMHPVQQAWIDEQVPQCGYCQSGMIMAVAALLAKDSDPDDETINKSITNICRCGTYPRIRRAIHHAADLQQDSA